MSDEETSTATPTSSLPKSGGDSSSEDLPSSEQVSPAPAATVASPLDDDGTDWTSLIYSKGGTPFAKREETVKALRALMGTAESRESAAAAANASTTTMDAAQQRQQQQQTQRHPLSNVHGAGPLFLSNIPKSSTKPGVCVGIDEAGRGSVLGPMVYGAAFWNASLDGDKKKIPPGFNDSKQLTEGARETLLEQLLASEDIGFAVRVLHASEISRNMLRAGRSYNLNQMSHDSAMAMIRSILKAGVPIQTCYIDTVGNADVYRQKLEKEFPSLDFVVESKADAKYATCSAASVVAKNVRDRMLETWQFTEPFHASAMTRDFGSGYPSDPKCKEWMQANLCDAVFGWPDLVRFSWGPAKKNLLKEGAAVVFEADDEEEENTTSMHMSQEEMAGRKRQQEQMNSFLKKGRAKEQQRLPYFERRNLKAVTSCIF